MTASNPSHQRIVIFGATSAIAHQAARLWVERGAHLFLVGRSATKLQSGLDDLKVRAGQAGAAHLHARQADLDDLSAHAPLLAEAAATLGSIDVVLIAYGSLPDQRACEADATLAVHEMNVNGVSVVHLAELVARHFERQGRGALAVIGSVAGDRGRQSNYVYGAAKGMVALYLQGLRNRLHPLGIAVTTVKPGFVDTPMTAAFPKKGPLWAQPDQIARGVVAAVDKRKDVVYLPGFWRVIMAIIRSIPEFAFKKLRL